MLLGMLLWWIVVKHHQHLNGMSDGQTIALVLKIPSLYSTFPLTS
jgi:hypothetical protein